MELVFISITGLVMLFQGRRISRHLTDWATEIPRLGFFSVHHKLSFTIWRELAISVAIFLMYIYLYWFELLRFQEATDHVTILLFRNFFPGLYFHPSFRYLSIFTLILQAYFTICARLIIFLPILLAGCIEQMGNEWRIRLTIALGTCEYLILYNLFKEMGIS